MNRERFTVYHSQCDGTGMLKMDLFQEIILNTACKAAEDGGFGIPELNKKGRTWVMARFQMHVNEQPRIGNKLTVETWIEQNRLGFSMRDFRVIKGAKVMAVARSVWAVIDLRTRENVNFNDLEHAPQPEGNAIELPSMARPVRSGETTVSRYRIRYSDLDQNGHCNSSRYVQIMEDAIGSEQGLRASDMLVSYAHEVFFGEEVTVEHTASTTGDWFVIRNAQGIACVTGWFCDN